MMLKHSHKRRKTTQTSKQAHSSSYPHQHDVSNPIVDLNVNDFVNARKREIQTFLASIRSSRQASNTRAFQSVSRDLRRRTASHDVKRVPKRLRSRAHKEMKDDNTPTRPKFHFRKTTNSRFRYGVSKQLNEISQSRAKPLRNSDHPATSTFVKNAKDSAFTRKKGLKRTLPTHVWHTKRARMTTVWGFRMPETPTLKCYRRTNRNIFHTGGMVWDTSYDATFLLEAPEYVLKSCLEALLPPADLAIHGKQNVLGNRLIKTWAYSQHSWPTKLIGPVLLWWVFDGKARGTSGSTKKKSNRQVVVRVHPAAAAQLLEALSSLRNHLHHQLSILDLRSRLGAITLAGPCTKDVLRGIISAKSDEILFKPNTVLGVNILINVPKDSMPPASLTSSIENIDLFQLLQRNITHAHKPRQERVGRVAVPGYLLPVLLSQTVHSENVLHEANPQAWTILMPWYVVKPVWNSLLRVSELDFGGIQEMRQMYHSCSSVYFPDDFSASAAAIKVHKSHDSPSPLTQFLREALGINAEAKYHEHRKLPSPPPLLPDIDERRSYVEKSAPWQISAALFKILCKPSGSSSLPVHNGVFAVEIFQVTNSKVKLHAKLFMPSAFPRLPQVVSAALAKPNMEVLKSTSRGAGNRHVFNGELEQVQPCGIVTSCNANLRIGGVTGIGTMLWRYVHEDVMRSVGFCYLVNPDETFIRTARWRILAC